MTAAEITEGGGEGVRTMLGRTQVLVVIALALQAATATLRQKREIDIFDEMKCSDVNCKPAALGA